MAMDADSAAVDYTSHSFVDGSRQYVPRTFDICVPKRGIGTALLTIQRSNVIHRIGSLERVAKRRFVCHIRLYALHIQAVQRIQLSRISVRRSYGPTVLEQLAAQSGAQEAGGSRDCC